MDGLEISWVMVSTMDPHVEVQCNNVWKYVKYCNIHRVLVLYALYIQGIMHSTNTQSVPDPVFHPNGWNGVDHDPGSISGSMTPDRQVINDAWLRGYPMELPPL